VKKMRSFLKAVALAAMAVGAEIMSVNDLNEAFDDVPSLKVGFLSRGNYESIQSVLPRETANGGKLEVVLFASLEELETAVLEGDVVAGLATSKPANGDRLLNEFGAGLITPRASFFGGDANSKTMMQAIDAAIVRVIAKGTYQQIEAKYFKSNGYESVAALTCSPTPDFFPFPVMVNETDTSMLKDMFDSGVLKVGSLGKLDAVTGATGPAQWGYQGDYSANPPTGFWPEYEAAIFDELFTAYPAASNGDPITVTRVWNASSVGVMDAVSDGGAHMTAPYWTVPAFYNDVTRHYDLSMGCTTLGTEQWFFTKREMIKASLSDDEGLSGGVIAGITIAVIFMVMACSLLLYMIRKEKKGNPVFSPLLVGPGDKDQPLV